MRQIVQHQQNVMPVCGERLGHRHGGIGGNMGQTGRILIARRDNHAALHHAAVA